MNGDELEAQALKLDPRGRARLAERLLRSLETLDDDEVERLWIEEAERRDAEIDANPATLRRAADVLRSARS